VAVKVHKCIERFKIPGDLRREEKKNPGSACKNWNGTPPEKLVVFRDRVELPASHRYSEEIETDVQRYVRQAGTAMW
jgi:hypothetical protein